MAVTDEPTDLSLGAFTSDAPWIIDRAEIGWLPGLAAVRLASEREVPDLVKPRRFPPGPRVGRVVWHIGTALLGWLAFDRRKPESASRAGISRRLRIAAEQLGPTYIKLGQIISSGEGIFPKELVEEFKKCRDQVPAEDFEDVRRVVEEDLGAPLSAIFSSFEPEPIAAASIAQVHAATLTSGENVVVKVQRPSVQHLVHADLRVMAWVAPHLVGRIPIAALANPPALVELFAETINEELDFRLEAANMLDIAAAFADLGQRGYVVPRPHPRLVTPRVLVMERLHGYAFDDIATITEAGLDGEAIVRTGMIGFMEGAMLRGVFHGDLHGGNLLVLEDGRIGLLDYGITARMGEDKRQAFLRLLVAASMNDIRSQLEALAGLGALPADTDFDAMILELELDRPPPDPTQMTAEEMTDSIQQILKQMLGYGARMPKELMLFVKNMVFLDGAIASLAPNLDIFAEMATISMYFAETHGERIASDIGLEVDSYEMDLDGMKASFGVDVAETDTLTYDDLLERRALIRDRMQEHRSAGKRRWFGRRKK